MKVKDLMVGTVFRKPGTQRMYMRLYPQTVGLEVQQSYATIAVRLMSDEKPGAGMSWRTYAELEIPGDHIIQEADHNIQLKMVKRNPEPSKEEGKRKRRHYCSGVGSCRCACHDGLIRV